MRVWFTRPDLWDCISKGIGRCTVWLEPPHFDATPVGAADPLYPHNPIGWTLPLAGEGQWQLSQRVNGLLNDHPDLALTLFDALSRSIDGQGRRDGMYQEWTRLLDSDCWWRVARQASGAALMNANRIQAQLTSDLPF